MDIYYEDHGQGFPILLLHGNQENRKIYNRLISDLEDHYRLIAIDTRYHGKSIKSGEVSLHQFALDVKSVADELHLEAYDVIGFSDGANIALTLASMDERMKSMTLLSPNSTPKGIKAIYRIGMILQLILLPIFMIYNQKARRMFKLTKFMLNEPHFDYDYLHSLKIPALLMSGENDMIKASDITFIGESLPYCISHVMENSSHFLLEDAYQNVLKEIRGFLYASHQN